MTMKSSLLLAVLRAFELAMLIVVIRTMFSSTIEAFPFHPLGMCCFFALAAEGVFALRNQKTSTKDQRRFKHFFFQAPAILCAILGYAAIVTANYPDYLFAAGASISWKIHVILGYSILLALLVQGASGVRKLQLLRHGPEDRQQLRREEGEGAGEVKTMKWHGKLGRAVVALACLNVFIAVTEEADAFGEIQQAVMYLAVALIAIIPFAI